MKIYYENNNLIIEGLDNFDLERIFTCGQCFRWNNCENGDFLGVVQDRALRIGVLDSRICLYQTTMEDFENIWRVYFDIDRDYENIKKTLSVDNVMTDAIKFGNGIRILNQSLWETVCSFIISASNNIPRIKKIVECLCKNFGDEISYMGNTFFTFPTAETISKLSISDLSVIRAGFRDKYILDAAKKFATDEKFKKEYMKNLSKEDAKKLLMTINGVGEKVADCVLLFALEKYESFPVDVWMKRIMEYCYFEKKEQSIKVISSFSTERFGELSGFAQQYLFFYARENKIGI